MKNPKILPFGDWFRVYESAGRNYEKSQRILESKMYKGLGRVFEAADASLKQVGVGPDLKPVDKGNPVYDISLGGVTPEWGWLNTEENGAIYDVMYDTIGFGKIPKMFIFAGLGFAGSAAWNKSNDEDSMMDIFKLLIAGIGRASGIEELGARLTKEGASKEVEKLGLKAELDKEVMLVGLRDGSVNASAKIDAYDGKLDPKKPVNNVDIRYICFYVNTFNLINFASGDYTQYVDLAECLDDKNVLQLNTGAGIKKAEKTLYLYSPYKGEATAGSRNEITTVQQGQEALDDSALISFSPGKFAESTDTKGAKFPVDAKHPEVVRVGEAIANALKNKDEQITSMEIVCGASPDWNGKPTAESEGTGEPGGGRLNDTNFLQEPTALGNEWLAWRRGQQFADALVEFLGDKRIKKDGITIKWQVKKTAPANGRNLTYKVLSKGVAPKETKETVYVSAAYNVSKGANSVYRYKFTWNYSAMAEAEKTWLNKVTKGLLGKTKMAYGDIAVGDEIKYYPMKLKDPNDRGSGYIVDTNKKNIKNAKVTKVEDGVIYIDSVKNPGEFVKIGEERFAGLLTSGADDNGPE